MFACMSYFKKVNEGSLKVLEAINRNFIKEICLHLLVEKWLKKIYPVQKKNGKKS